MHIKLDYDYSPERPTIADMSYLVTHPRDGHGSSGDVAAMFYTRTDATDYRSKKGGRVYRIGYPNPLERREGG